MEETFVPIKKRLDELADNAARISYLELYLRDNSGVPLSLLARIYQWLGELHYAEGRPKGAFFEKAASAWEMAAIIEAKDDGSKRDFFAAALKNYKFAGKLYRKDNSWDSAQSLEMKMGSVVDELRKYGGPSKTAGIILLIGIFFASFILLSGPPTTGFVVYPPMEEDQTTLTGIGLAVLGVIGAIFVLWKWR